MTTTLSETKSLIDHVLNNTSQVFSPPAHALKVVEMADREDSSATELKALIESDPALAARILKAVNSGALGETRQVAEVGQAITLLGVKAVRLLALGFSLPRDGMESATEEINRLNWRFSVVKAVTARKLAESHFTNQDSDNCFIAGLLQDLGVSVLIHEMGEPYTSFLTEVHDNGNDLSELEIESLGFSHRQLTARLLDRWNIPEQIVLSVGQSFEASVIKDLPSPEKENAQTLHLAELIAQLVTFQNEGAAQRFLLFGNEYLGLSTEDAKALLAKLESQAGKLAESMEVDIGEIDSHESLLARAHEHLARMSEEQVAAITEQGPNNAKPKSHAQLIAVDQTLDRRSMDEDSIGLRADSNGLSANGNQDQDSSGFAECVVCESAKARDQRRPFSLVLISLEKGQDDDNPAILLKAQFVVKQILQKVWDEDHKTLILENGRIAVLVQSDRHYCAEKMRQLNSAVETWNRIQQERGSQTICCQSGIACLSMVPRNMSHHRLFEAANGCLTAAMISPSSSIKSIDVL